MNIIKLKVLFTLFLVVLMKNANSQTDTVDLEIIPVEKELDIPTILIDSSHRGLKNAMDCGFVLIAIEPQACNTENVYDKINSYKDVPIINNYNYNQFSDTILIDYSVIANCCSNFVGSIDCQRYNSDLTLITELHEYGYDCECFCCFNLTFIVKTSKEINSSSINLAPSLNGVIINFGRE